MGGSNIQRKAGTVTLWHYLNSHASAHEPCHPPNLPVPHPTACATALECVRGTTCGKEETLPVMSLGWNRITYPALQITPRSFSFVRHRPPKGITGKDDIICWDFRLFSFFSFLFSVSFLFFLQGENGAVDILGAAWWWSNFWKSNLNDTQGEPF